MCCSKPFVHLLKVVGSQGIFIFGFVLMVGRASMVSAQESVVFSHQNHSAFPNSLIDSIRYSIIMITPRRIPADSVSFNTALPDTIVLDFHDDFVEVINPHLNYIEVLTHKASVSIRTFAKQPFVCLAKGTCGDGRLIIDADTTCTLLLSGLQLSSKEGNVIFLRQKQKAEIVLMDGTTSTLIDAQQYCPKDTTDTSKGCLYTKGSLTFSGSGTLNVIGNYRHAIASSKNITVEDGIINILGTVKDGIHCDKYKQQGGKVTLHLSQAATKGIKTKKMFELTKGYIEGDAVADLKITDGKTSYCTLIKSDSVFMMQGGQVTLRHRGKGGCCISADRNLYVTNGTMDLECSGDGDRYLTAANDSDYYTPKCIMADDSVFIRGGNISCMSTGLGGKGIVSGRYLAIGNEEATMGDTPIIRIETKGECIFDNVDEDLRFGCPKGIKAEDKLYIYSGDIAINTAGMGGEGVECNGDMYIYGGTLECNTFDDGINVGRSLEIAGGRVYCNSEDNDGIDSNGSLTISGGIVASINQEVPNESLDSEQGQFYLTGGTVFAIGSMPVKIRQSSLPCYNIQKKKDPDSPKIYGFVLHAGKYICLQDNTKVIMALKNGNRAQHAYLTIADSNLSKDAVYYISEGECPSDAKMSFFDQKLIYGGTPVKTSLISDIQF